MQPLATGPDCPADLRPSKLKLKTNISMSKLYPHQGGSGLERLSPGPTEACGRHGLDCFKRFYIMSFIRWHGPNSPMDGTCWPSQIRESVGRLTCVPQWSWQDGDCPWPFPRGVTRLQTQGLFYLSNLVTEVVLSCLTGYGPGHLFLAKVGQVALRVFELLHTGHDATRPPPPYAGRVRPLPTYGPGPEEGG